MADRPTLAQLAELLRFTTPTIINALELCCTRPRLEGFSREEVRDFMPDKGPLAGYAVTAEYCASRPAGEGVDRTEELLRRIEQAPKPVIVVVRDVDSPDGIVGAPWGECFSTMCQALGAVGTITDGAIRDLDEMRRVGFRALARRLCVSHAYGHITSVGEPVNAFGLRVQTGDLLHADQHGFVILPPESWPRLAEAAAYLEDAERTHILGPARAPGFSAAKFAAAAKAFRERLAAGTSTGAASSGDAI